MTSQLPSLARLTDRVPRILRELVLALVLVLAASLLAWALRSFGDRRVSMVFLLPVLFSGFMGGLRAGLIAATISYLVYDLFIVPPLFSLFVATTHDTIALIVFATAAIVTGLGSGALRDEQKRAKVRSQTILTLLETNNFFAITPNEAAIRQRLVDGVAAIAGTGAVFADADGIVTHRAGMGADWMGGLEGELSNLARMAMQRERGGAVARGRFRARATRAPTGALGAAVWLERAPVIWMPVRRHPDKSPEPIARTRDARERDEHIAMMIELAASALSRCQRELEAERA